MSRPNVSIPLFCIFGIEYPEISKSTVSDLTLQVVDPYWTFREFVDEASHQSLEIIQKQGEGDAELKAFVASVQSEHINVVELRVNTCRGVPKAIYYELLLLYYDERRIGDHIVNDYGQSEHTIVQIYVQVRKERRDRSSSIREQTINMSPSSSLLTNHYQPANVSARVRAHVRLKLVQAWQAAFIKYKDCRVRHIMHPRNSHDNDFTHIGIVKPFRVDLKRLAVYNSDTNRGDNCAVQVLAYDKATQQSAWFEILIAAHCTLRRCKERIVEAVRQTLDWDASVEEIPHLIARCYQNNEMEDFLLCDDTMTLSFILSPRPLTMSAANRRPSHSVLPVLTVIAFVGRHGRRVSDSKGRCVFEEEEHGTQLLMAAMGVYLNNFVEKTAQVSLNGTQTDDKKTVEKEKEQRVVIDPDQVKKTSQLMKKERQMSLRKTSRQTSRGSHTSNRSRSTCQGCIII